MNNPEYIFISYPHTEKDLVLRLATDFKNQGVAVWMDILERGIQSGQDWRRSLEAGIDNCSIFVPIICPDFINSKYCLNELGRADRIGRKISPVLLREIEEKTDLPIEIERIQFTDFTQTHFDSNAYQKAFSKLLQDIQNEVTIDVDTLPTVETIYLNRFISDLKRQKGIVDYVELAGQAIATTRPQHSLSDLWGLESSFSLLENSINESVAFKGNEDRTTFDSIHEIIEMFDQFIIVGASGAGKTTTLKHLALNSAYDRIDFPHLHPLPIYCNVSTWQEESSFQEFISQTFPFELQSLLIKGEVVLFVDGLNEMGKYANDNIKKIKQYINNVKITHRIVLASREDMYVGDLILDRLPVISIEPLDTNRIYKFVQNYLKEDTEEFMNQVLAGADTREGFLRIKEDSHSVNLHQLATNPYLLTALMLVFKNSGDAFPSNRGSLFQLLVVALWERERLRHTGGWISLEDMMNALSLLAYKIINDSKSTSVSVDYATKIVGYKDLLQVGHSSSLLELSGDEVRFSHQNLLDYFAALYLQNQDFIVLATSDYSKFDRLTVVDAWDYPIISMYGISQNKGEILGILIKEGYPSLALRCLQSGIELMQNECNFVIDTLLDDYVETFNRNFEVESSNADFEKYAKFLDDTLLYAGQDTKLHKKRAKEWRDLHRNIINDIFDCINSEGVPRLVDRLEKPQTRLLHDYIIQVLKRIGTPDALLAVRNSKQNS